MVIGDCHHLNQHRNWEAQIFTLGGGDRGAANSPKERRGLPEEKPFYAVLRALIVRPHNSGQLVVV